MRRKKVPWRNWAKIRRSPVSKDWVRFPRMSSSISLVPDIRLQPVRLKKDDDIKEILAFYMGKNTPERQDFIIDRLRVEEDPVEVA